MLPLKSLFMITIPGASSMEYVLFAQDMMRMLTIQVMIQTMYAISGVSDFFTADFIVLVLYIILGVSMYWLVVKKVIDFTSAD